MSKKGIYHDDPYVDFMLSQMPDLTEEEHEQKMKDINEFSDQVIKKRITPNLDSIY